MGRDGLVVAGHGHRSSQFACRLKRVRVAARGRLHVLAAKVFLGCLFVLGQLPAGSPAGGRFPESSRPAGAAVGCCRRRRATVGQLVGRVPAAFVWWGRTRPLARGPEKPLGGGDGSRYVWFVVDGVFRFEASKSLPKIICSEQCTRLLHLFEHFWLALIRKKHIASRLIPRSTTT